MLRSHKTHRLWAAEPADSLVFAGPRGRDGPGTLLLPIGFPTATVSARDSLQNADFLGFRAIYPLIYRQKRGRCERLTSRR